MYCKPYIWGFFFRQVAYSVNVVDLIKTPDYPLYQATYYASIISLGYLFRYLGHRRYSEECKEPDLSISCSRDHHYNLKRINNTINCGVLLHPWEGGYGWKGTFHKKLSVSNQ